MILLIDNYDSFSYNLYQLIGTIEPDIQVVRNDELSLEDIHKLNPQAIVLSPGPGHPHEAGIIESVIKQFYRSVPILGICLGHQAICEVFQSEITYAKELMHGKTSLIYLQDDVLFQGLEKSIQVARYHSLIVKNLSLIHILQNVVTNEMTQIDCDGLFVAIGRIPDTEIVKGQLELDKSGYIIADESTCTNIPGVFAIGDVRTKALRQIVTAASDGATCSYYIEQYLLDKE